MKNKLIDLVKTIDPKKISQAIKKDQSLFNWIQQATGETISEKIYNTIYTPEINCKYGNKKKFKSITAGYGFCHSTSRCQCAKESIAKKVSEKKSQYSQEIKKQIQEKKKETVQKLYGVENVGQLERSKSAHRQIYFDLDKVEKINEKIKQTKQIKYSDPNFNNPEKIKQTYKEKRDNGFWIDRYPEKNIETLEDKNRLYDLYIKNNPSEIADLLNVHVQTVYRYLNHYGIREPFKSSDEDELIRFVQELGITNIVRNTRKLLPSKKEIDIFLPDLNIAIEYNGVYWHHEDVSHITRDYHYNKFIECERLGVQLITIFSNFWHNKKEIVKNMLRIKLNQFEGPKIYAKKCKIEYIDNKLAKNFLNGNHIQGYTPSNLCLGLFNDKDLVAVMTFSKNRTGIGKTNNHTELVRFASSGLIVGAAGKLLCFYRKNHPSEIIVSYSDNEWSKGDLYKTLGFQLGSEIKYSYWYLKPREHKLYHRFSFSKQKLIARGFDPTKSEAHITKEMGLLKVWDCGKRKWVLNS
jgi:hypothetical protein